MLLHDLDHLADEVNLARREEQDLSASWDSELSPDDRNDVTALVTAKHHIKKHDVEAWKRRFPKLKIVSLAFTGYDDVDLTTCKHLELSVYYCPGYSTASVAELAVCLALALRRNLLRSNLNARTGAWDSGGVVPGVELEGSTVGIIGTGHIGTATAQKFAAMGCNVIGWNRTMRKPSRVLAYRRTPKEVFEQADIVSVHLELNKETTGFVGKKLISAMRRGSLLINTSRGAVVDAKALAAALTTGAIGSAGIDVFLNEPVDTVDKARRDVLLRLDPASTNLIVTPHVGFKTSAALERLARMAIENVRGKHRKRRLVP